MGSSYTIAFIFDNKPRLSSPAMPFRITMTTAAANREWGAKLTTLLCMWSGHDFRGIGGLVSMDIDNRRVAVDVFSLEKESIWTTDIFGLLIDNL